MIIVYGIPNCDTVRKARAWLVTNGLAHTFHDFKQRGVPMDNLHAWAAFVGWEVLLNRKGTTWRTLSAVEQDSSSDSNGAFALAVANPGLMKRPVVEWGAGALKAVTVGFNADAWAENAAEKIRQDSN